MTNFIVWINGTLSSNEIEVTLRLLFKSQTKKTETEKWRWRRVHWKIVTQIHYNTEIEKLWAQVEATMTKLENSSQWNFRKFLFGENFMLINSLPAHSSLQIASDIIIGFWTKTFSEHNLDIPFNRKKFRDFSILQRCLSWPVVFREMRTTHETCRKLHPTRKSYREKFINFFSIMKLIR